MYRMELAVVLAAASGLGGWSLAENGAADRPPLQATAPADPVEGPPLPWLQGDPADSLYRAAREALNRREFRQAADLFAALPGRFPRSGYAGDAYYWQAFALYRVGGEPRLREALQALRIQREKYPQASTNGDARALEARIQGELARAGDSEAAEDVTEAAAQAAEADESSGGCDEDDTKLAALNALIHMNSERAQPILKRVLTRRDAGSVCLRRKAVFLVSQGGAGAEPILLESARSDPDREVREQAVFWLSQVGGATAVAALDSILRSSRDVGVQEKAIFALSQHGGPEAQRALRGYAERADLSPDLREKAVFWIGQSGGSEDAQYLRQLFGRVKEEELRKKILFSLSQMGGQENERWLLGVARDRQQAIELRKQALFWAGQGGAPMADLAALYTTMDDREMREQLIFVYSQREEPAAVDKLLEIARRDPDTEMRKKALFWLGQSDDPRAAKALQDIIEQP
jgi:HEAT repeat protein